MDNETTIYLQDGQFRFEGDFKNPAKISLRVRTKAFSNYIEYESTEFWVENKAMLLEGSKGNIFLSKVSGSKIQDEYYEKRLAEAPLMQSFKQIIDSLAVVGNISDDKKEGMIARLSKANNKLNIAGLEFIFDSS